MKKAIIFIFLLSITFLISYNNSAQKHHKTTPMPTSAHQTLPAKTPSIIKDDNNIYIGNKHSKKFHRKDCYSLPKEKNRVEFSSRENAINSGYSPCGNCCP